MTRASTLIVYTGGTIGMIPSTSGLIPNPNFAETACKWIKQAHLEADFTVRMLDPLIDSADAVPSLWRVIARAILDEQKNFDGFVILHGTDTMAYTASALSYLLRGFGKPVILTGAQFPYGESDSDAKANLVGAFRCAANDHIQEVCIFFDQALLRGNRSIKFSTRIGDGFASPHWPPLGQLRDTLVLNKAALLEPEVSPPELPPLMPIARTIGLIKVYPGLSEEILLAAAHSHKQGLVLELYGSGTAPMLDRGLRTALEYITDRNIPLVGVSQCVRGAASMPGYQSSQVLRDLGVIPGYDLTPEAALTKMNYCHARGLRNDEFPAAMTENLAGEITLPTKTA